MQDEDVIKPLIRDAFLMKVADSCKWLEGEDLHYLKEAISLMYAYCENKQNIFCKTPEDDKKFRKILKACYAYTDELHYYCMIKKNNTKLTDTQLQDYCRVLKKFSTYYPHMVYAFCKLVKNTPFGNFYMNEAMISKPIGRPSEFKKQTTPPSSTTPRIMM